MICIQLGNTSVHLFKWEKRELSDSWVCVGCAIGRYPWVWLYFTRNSRNHSNGTVRAAAFSNHQKSLPWGTHWENALCSYISLALVSKFHMSSCVLFALSLIHSFSKWLMGFYTFQTCISYYLTQVWFSFLSSVYVCVPWLFSSQFLSWTISYFENIFLLI